MSLNDSKKISAIVADAGGTIVGRTRLQKIAYLLSVTGMETGFSFSYKHYGPFSEDVAAAAQLGNLLGILTEEEKSTNWGGRYSTYTTDESSKISDTEPRRNFASVAAQAESIELELAATAVFLSIDGYEKPWEETARRKPEKVGNGRLAKAQNLLKRLSKINTPNPLPSI